MRVTIEKLVYGGAGLARTSDGVIFVPRSAPGDVLEIRLVGRKKDYAVGQIVEIVTASPDRQTADCPNYGTAGCCHWQHIRYERQLDYKEAILRESLKRGSRTEWTGTIRRISGADRGYRMRASFHVRNGELGFMAEQSHTIVPIQSCASLTPQLNAFIKDTNRVIPAAEFRTLQEIHAVADSDIAATFVFSEQSAEQPWDRIRDAVFQIPHLTALTIRSGSHRSHLHKSIPTVEVGTHRFELNSDTFFQANRFLLAPFAAEVLRQTGTAGHLLELYSGAGFFSIPLAASCRELLAVESSSTAVRQARENARANGVHNVNFVTADVEASLAASDIHPEVVVLNPPRTGAGAKAATRIAELQPRRIVYVSCNPTTLAREIRVFAERGYELKDLTLIDQFPNTYHIESVALFERR